MTTIQITLWTLCVIFIVPLIATVIRRGADSLIAQIDDFFEKRK